MDNSISTFDPSRFSDEANEFFLAHLGEPAAIALASVPPPVPLARPHPKDKNPVHYPLVHPATVRPVLQRVNELQDEEKFHNMRWIGVEAIKDAIRVWQRENAKWARDHQRTNGRAPRWPSLYTFDAKGNKHLGGPGSDSGYVKTYFAADGSRIPFAVDLVPGFNDDWLPPSQGEVSVSAELFLDEASKRYECRVPLPDGTFCGHTESFKSDSRASKNAARARMSKHLRKATEEIEAHRTLHTLEFTSGS